MTAADAPREGVKSQDEAGFANQLPLGVRPALVMVDLVRAYFEPGAQLYMGDASPLHGAAELLAAARAARIPVIHTRVTYSGGGADGGYFFQKVGALREFVGDTPLGQIMPEVAPDGAEVTIVKQYASAFFGTSLASTLSTLGVDTVLIAGVSTSGCIRATAVDAIQSGFIPVVVREAVGDRHPAPHEASLFDIQAKYGEVRDLSTVTDYLQHLNTGDQE
jgi:maleamate amidohydrolase